MSLKVCLVCTALEAEGLGCNLQHYHPLIDVKVSTEWNIDPDWSLKSQTVFGKPTGQPENRHWRIDIRSAGEAAQDIRS